MPLQSYSPHSPCLVTSAHHTSLQRNVGLEMRHCAISHVISQTHNGQLPTCPKWPSLFKCSNSVTHLSVSLYFLKTLIIFASDIFCFVLGEAPGGDPLPPACAASMQHEKAAWVVQNKMHSYRFPAWDSLRKTICLEHLHPQPLCASSWSQQQV